MHPQIEIKHSIGNILSIPNELIVKITTFLSNNTSPGATSIPVDNTTGFTTGSNILLLLSGLGNGNSEIVRSTGNTISSFTTLATTLAHLRGESAQEITYDQLVVLKSTTLNGTYVQLGSDIPLQVTQMNTVVIDSAGLTTDYYKVQWKNSITGAGSPLSAPISVLSYPSNSAGEMFASITNLMGIQENDKIITPKFLIDALEDARQFAQSKMGYLRHPWTQKFNHPIKVLAGSNYINLPDDIDFDKTDQSLLAARFLTNNILVPYNMRYCDKRAWNQVSFYSTGGINQTNAVIGATTLTLNSVGDFAPQGGSAQVATTDFDQVVMQIQYTSVDYVTNQLLGVTGVTRAIPAGTQIWATATMSQPIWYTVFDDKIWFTSIIPDSMQANNCYIDYYRKMVKIVDLYEEIPEHYRNIYKPYIRWAIKYRKDVNTPQSDPDLVKFESLVDALVSNLYTGQDTVLITS